jgi:alpha-beta hydrolase superfamily lysophospholipase
MGAAGSLVGLVCLFGLLPRFLADRVLHPPRRKPALTPAAVGLDYEEVTFRGLDVELAGWYVPADGDRAVVLVHGFGEDRCELMPLAPALHGAGYHVLLYDMRARGASGGDTVTFGYFEVDDLVAAANFLRERSGACSVAALGVSLGASVALLAAARGNALDAVVADSAFADLRALIAEGTPLRLFNLGAAARPFWKGISSLIVWHAERQSGLRASAVCPLDQVAQIGLRPVLFIHGLKDSLFNYRNSVHLYHAAGEAKEIWLVPDAAHTRAYARYPDEYMQRILAFLDRGLTPSVASSQTAEVSGSIG